MIEKFEVTLTLDALVNGNENFPRKAHAIDIVDGMIGDAISQCLRLQGRCVENDDLYVHLERKIKAYESMRNTIK